jgi:glycosyltransferase involved in cell wall biosynthesis
MVKTILILNTPMPYSKIGSWTTMYNYYLQSNNHQFDYIVCPKPDVPLFDNIFYSFIKPKTLYSKLKAKFKFEHRLQNYFSALDKIIQNNQKYIIHIVDNSGLVIPLNYYLKTKHDLKNFYVQYFYQGHPPIIANPNESKFYESINEMLFLTKMSYKAHLNYYRDFPCKVSILNNATNSNHFFKLDNNTKELQKQKIGITKKIVFIWCSQDRPKKGLHLILEAWKKIYEKYNHEVQLLIVGIDREINQDGVNVIGRVPNNELAIYYQISDFYLFSTLCREGFGIVLAEALKCGCYCIASNQGGVPEVLEFGKLGKIIENPNFVNEWVEAIEESIEDYKSNNYQNPYYQTSFNKLYDLEIWSEELNTLLRNAKQSFET